MTPTSRSELERLIARTAAAVRRCWPGNVNDVDDLIQEGHLAALKAEAVWNEDGGPFLRYARTVVRRAMHEAAARAAGAATASRRSRTQAIGVQRLRRQEMTDEQIAEQTGITRSELDAVEQVFKAALPLESDAVCIEREPYDVLEDLLVCPRLNDEERTLIRLLAEHGFGEVAQLAALSTSSLGRKRAAIRRKLVRSGYGR